MADVFISYKREDKARVAAIAEALEQEGFSVWWDPEIPLGESYAVSIRRELEAASTVLAIWSNQSVQSEWVQEEATLGKRKGALVPARIEAVDPPVGFTMTQTADLVGWSGDRTNEEWRRLVEHVAANAKRPPRAIPQGYKPPARSRRGLMIGGGMFAVIVGVAVALGVSGAIDFSGKASPSAVSTSAPGAPAGDIPSLGAAMSFRGAEGGVMTAAISPDGRFVATGDAVGSVRFYDASNAVPAGEAKLRAVTGSVRALAWRTNDALAAFGAGSFANLARDGGTPAPGSTDWDVSLAAPSPNAGWIAIAAADGRIVGPEGASATLPDDARAQSIAFDAAGRRMLVGGSAGWLYLYAAPPPFSEPQRLHMVGTSAVRGAFMPDGRRIVAAAYGRVVIGEIDNWGAHTVLEIPGDNAPNTAFALSRDGRFAAVALEEKRIYVWNLQTQRLIGRAEVPGGATYLGFTPDGMRLLAAAPDGDASLYDVPQPAP